MRPLNVLAVVCLCLAVLPIPFVTDAGLPVERQESRVASGALQPSTLHTLPSPPYVPGEVIVKLRDGATLSREPDQLLRTNRPSLDATLKRVGVRQSARVFSDIASRLRSQSALSADLTRVYRLKLDAATDVREAAAMLAADPDVEYAEPNYIAYATTSEERKARSIPVAPRSTLFAPRLTTPDDPLYGEQWGLTKIGAEAAWSVVTGTPAVAIAIVDGGIDRTHEDLAAQLWTNPGEISGNLVDDDNNGWADDVNGWDFLSNSSVIEDDNGHGTEVAGVAGAVANNGRGIAGVCWGCRLMIVKVLQPSGVANYSDIAKGVAYAAAKGAKVINISLGGYADSNTLRAAIQAAAATSVIVAGAGNGRVNTPFYPAAYPDVLAVAAITSTNAKADSSNYGSWVDVAAPGVDIRTTALGGAYAANSGASLAAPFVSGLAGLVWSLHPDWSPTQVRAHIIQTADSLAASDPTYGGQLGAGLINMARAVQLPEPSLVIAGYAVNGATHGAPSPPSDNNSLVVSLRNDWYDATAVTANLSTSDAAVTVVNGQATFGNVATGATVIGSALTFNVGGAGFDHPIPFFLNVSANGETYSATLPFTVTTRGPEEVISSANIIANTEWTSDTVYVINTHVTVNPGVTLTIRPGTVVKFNGNYELNVWGTLIADGTADQLIQFKSNTTDRWNRIYFDDHASDAVADANGSYVSGSILRHVIIRSSTNGIGCGSATPYLAHVTSTSSGINCTPGATPLWLLDNAVSGGINITLGTVYAVRNTLSGNGLRATGAAFVFSNTVAGDGVSISTGQLSANTVSGGSLSMGDHSTAADNTLIGGGISGGNMVTVTNNFLSGGGISVGSSATVLSNTVQNARDAGVTCGVNVNARYNRLIGNRLGMVAQTGWIGNNLIANSAGPALQVSGVALSATMVVSNSFTGNMGHTLVAGGVSPLNLKIEGNNLEGNTGPYDLYVTIPWQGQYVLAQRNWWGVFDIVTGTVVITDYTPILARIYDFNDDSAVSKVTFAPPLNAPAQDAPAYARKVTIDPDNVLGIQQGEFTVLFSRPMDPSVNPALTFCTTQRGAWDRYTATNSGLPGNSVSAIAGDMTGNLWFGTSAQGAARLANATWTVYSTTNSGLPSNAVNAIAGDPDGSMWFGTPSGASRLSGGVWTAYTDTSGTLPDTNVLALAIDDDWVKWFGTANGLGRFDGATWVTYTTGNSGLPSNRVTAIAVGGDRTLWFGTDRGVARFDGMDWTAFTAVNSGLPSDNIQAIAVDDEGARWIGTNDGVARFDGSVWTVYTTTSRTPDPVTKTSEPRLPGLDVRAIVVDSRGDKWFGTAGGLAHFDGKWTQYTTANSDLPSNDIRALAASAKNIKWIGARDAGAGTLYDSLDYFIGDNAQWLASNQYRATFDFSVLIARGVYSLTVGSAPGLDGLASTPNTANSFTVDYAETIANVAPPPQPAVAAASDGSLTAISMSWLAPATGSKITGYRYAIGATPNVQDVVNWTDVASGLSGHQLETNAAMSAAVSFTRTGLALLPGQAYYVTVQARNEGGLWSQRGVSNRVVARSLDTTPPITPQVTVTSTASLTTLAVSWTSQDPESGIDQYRYAIGTAPGDRDVLDWVYAPMTTQAVTITGLSLVEGQTYYAVAAARNSRGLWSENGVSNPILIGMYKIYLPVIMR